MNEEIAVSPRGSDGAAAPAPVAAVQPPVSQEVSASSTTVTASQTENYANFGQRLGAMLIDGVVVGIPVMAVYFIIMMAFLPAMMTSSGTSTNTIPLSNGSTYSPNQNAVMAFGLVFWVVVLLLMVASYVYYVVGIGKYGKTLGKKVVGIKVVRVDNGEVPGIGKALLRQVIGYWLSSWIFYLGFFWMLWDQKRQTWHDKIAGTVVVKV